MKLRKAEEMASHRITVVLKMAKDLFGGDVTKDLGEVTDELITEGLVNHRKLHNYSIALSFVQKLLALVDMTNEMDLLWITSR